MTPFRFFSAMYYANVEALARLATTAAAGNAASTAAGEAAAARHDRGAARRAAPLCVDAAYGSACWISGDAQEAANEPTDHQAAPAELGRAA